MTKQNDQSGFAHLGVITIVITIGIICALGFVYYRNYIKNDADNTSQKNTENATKTDNSQNQSDKSTTDDTSDAASIAGVSSNGYLNITQWGIKGIYNEDYKVQYSFEDNTAPSILTLTSPDTGICSTRVLYAIYRYSGTDLVRYHGHLAFENPKTAESFYNSHYFGDDMKKIGDYYYVLEQGVTDACSDDINIQSPETQVMDGIRNLFSTLQLR